MELKNKNLNIDLADLGKKFKKIPIFLDKRRRIIIILLAIVLAGHVSFEYYNYIYNPVWSEEKTQAYINTKEKDAIFNQEDFDKVLAEIEKRKIEYAENSVSAQRDIFKISQ